MRVVYSGIDMMPIKTHEFTLEAVYDDTMTDYLFSRGTIVVEALITAPLITPDPNQFMNYTLAAGPGPAIPIITRVDRVAPTTIPIPAAPAAPIIPIPSVGVGVNSTGPSTPLGAVTRTLATPPVTTHAAIRHRLETPRQQLYLYSGRGMLEAAIPAGTTASPATWGATVLAAAPASVGMVCDCNNGPKPHLLSINESLGDTNTFVVVWGCEFYINESLGNGVSPIGALVSNRFSQTHSVDEHGWTTVKTTGTAIFRTDLIYGGGPAGIVPPPGVGLVPGTPTSPDAFRAALFLPIQQGFTRAIDYVNGMANVAGVEYGYTDTQVPVNFVAGPYVNPAQPGTGGASISVFHRQAIVTNSQDVVSGALNAFERVVGIKANKNIAKEKPKVEGSDLPKRVFGGAKRKTPPPIPKTP